MIMGGSKPNASGAADLVGAVFNGVDHFESWARSGTMRLGTVAGQSEGLEHGGPRIAFRAASLCAVCARLGGGFPLASTCFHFFPQF